MLPLQRHERFYQGHSTISIVYIWEIHTNKRMIDCVVLYVILAVFQPYNGNSENNLHIQVLDNDHGGY